ncbi:MAG: efflux RND transporter periplasmic adaptor subunit [Oceanicoccus sp.]
MNKKYLVSAVLAAAVALWLLSGLFKDDAQQNSDDLQQPAKSKDADTAIPLVRAIQSVAIERRIQLIVRGQTEENRQVEVRAEAAGRVVALPVEKGATVNAGDVLCKIAIDARDKSVIEAEAIQVQAALEYRGVKDLGKRGLQAETQIAQSKARLESSNAALARAKLQLAHTSIKSPFTGVVEDQPAELGDFLRVGDVCARVLDADPILMVGQVAEKDIAHVTLGDTVTGRLITGEVLSGVIRFIGQSSDTNTRAYRVEAEVPNPTFSTRAGITTKILMPLATRSAHAISPAILVLDDAGVMGVKLVNANNIVEFAPVEVIEENPNGIWVSGLPDNATIVVVGQEVVFDGNKVEVDLTPLENL